jgi:serpin B
MRSSRRATATLLALVSGALAACNGSPTDNSTPGGQADSLRSLPRAVSVTEQQGISANNAIALRLLRETAVGTTKNVLLSPFSVSTALGLTMNGAAGGTEDAMRTALGWGTRPRADINAAYRDLAALLPTLDPAVTFRSVNGIWVRTPMRAHPDFVSDASRFFNAGVNSAATPQAMFAAVNAWASTATDGLVPKALEEPPPDDLTMLLANAVLFKGEWRDRFDPANTTPRPFRLENGSSPNLPTMSRRGGFRASSDPTATAVELPYGNSAYSMLLVLPRTGTIGEYVARLDSARLADLVARLGPQSDVPLYLPRFKTSSSLELRPALTAMGMGVAFSDAASFPRLFDDGAGQKLEFVRHAVTVEVDEEGTKAAAVTIVGAVPTSASLPIEFNRPFLFFIRERFTGALLFSGVVRDPR